MGYSKIMNGKKIKRIAAAAFAVYLGVQGVSAFTTFVRADHEGASYSEFQEYNELGFKPGYRFAMRHLVRANYTPERCRVLLKEDGLEWSDIETMCDWDYTDNNIDGDIYFEWRKNRLNHNEIRGCKSYGIPLEDALERKQSPLRKYATWWIIDPKFNNEESIEKIDSFLAAGFNLRNALYCVDKNESVEDAIAWTDAGYSVEMMHSCNKAGRSLNKAKEWKAKGWADQAMQYCMDHDISLELAEKWHKQMSLEKMAETIQNEKFLRDYRKQ